MSVTAVLSMPVAISLLLLAIVLRIISLKILSGEINKKKSPILLNAKFLMSVVSETFWTGLSGIAVSAE